MAESNPPVARQLAERALTLNASLVSAHVFLAELALNDRDTTTAAASLARALAINPSSLDARALEAAIDWVEDRPADFDAHVASALAINPRFGAIYRIAGTHASRHYRFDDAVTLTRKGLAIDPDDVRAYAELGLHLLRTGASSAPRPSSSRARAARPGRRPAGTRRGRRGPPWATRRVGADRRSGTSAPSTARSRAPGSARPRPPRRCGARADRAAPTGVDLEGEVVDRRGLGAAQPAPRRSARRGPGRRWIEGGVGERPHAPPDRRRGAPASCWKVMARAMDSNRSSTAVRRGIRIGPCSATRPASTSWRRASSRLASGWRLPIGLILPSGSRRRVGCPDPVSVVIMSSLRPARRCRSRFAQPWRARTHRSSRTAGSSPASATACSAPVRGRRRRAGGHGPGLALPSTGSRAGPRCGRGSTASPTTSAST